MNRRAFSIRRMLSENIILSNLCNLLSFIIYIIHIDVGKGKVLEQTNFNYISPTFSVSVRSIIYLKFIPNPVVDCLGFSTCSWLYMLEIMVALRKGITERWPCILRP